MDIAEGADMIMVKSISYLDIIYRVKNELKYPTFVTASGEYHSLTGSQQGIINEETMVIEQLSSFKRAGADAIITYYAPEVSKFLNLID